MVAAVSAIFRDSDVLRENREKARLKFLFLRHGWTAASFLAELERRLGTALERAVPEDPPDDVYRDHVGFHPQKQPGLVYAGLAVSRGRMSPEQLRAVAGAAERFGNGTAAGDGDAEPARAQRAARERVRAGARARAEAGLTAGGSAFLRGTVACTGTEFCKLALAETKGFARWLVERLEERLPGFDQHLRINVTGCPNSCGQHWIADIGLDGKKTKIDGQLVDAYQFSIGGAVGRHRSFGRPTGVRVAATDGPGGHRATAAGLPGGPAPRENFRQFCARHTSDALGAFLIGPGAHLDAPEPTAETRPSRC